MSRTLRGLREKSTREDLPIVSERGSRGVGHIRLPAGKRRRSRFVGTVLFLCAVVSTVVAVDYWANIGEIHRGVEVDSVSLGGKTPEEAREVLEEHTDALGEIRVTADSEEFAFATEELGVNFDVTGVVERSYAAGRQGGVLQRLGDRIKANAGTVRVPLVVDQDRERLRDGLSGVFAALAVEPTEAGFEVDSTEISVTESRIGQKVDEEKLLDDFEAGLAEGRREYEVPIVADDPQLTTEEAEGMKPTELLGSYRTDYLVVPDDGTRVENLGISSGAVDETLLAPGEVFSMNEKVASLDYNEAKVIVNGAETKADGGGLCQVTSTLYNAANFAGLDVLERTPHSAQLPYIRPGMDATVWWGGPGEEDDLDMKFRNTTDGYLLLREYVAEDGYVHAEIWGRPNDVDVEMRSEPTDMGESGSEWVTYQKVEKDGEVLFDGVLHEDSYESLVDEHGREIPPSEVPVAPVDP